MQKSSKLELFYQIVKIHEFLKYARSGASKALLLDDLSGAMSAYCQRRTDTKNMEITNPKTKPRPMKCYRNYLIECRDLLNVHLDSTGKHQMESLVKKRNLSFLVI